MDKLRLFYTRWTKVLASILGGFGIIIGKDILPFIETQFADTKFIGILTAIITSSVIFGGLFILGCLFIRHCFWKLFYMKINVSGKWQGRTYYTEIKIDEEGKSNQDKLNKVSLHNANIKQNCLELQISPSSGEDYNNFKSLAINLSDDILRYAYEVKYKEKNLIKRKAVGYEEMEILQWHWGTPILLSGVFSHCADGEKPVFCGKALFFKGKYAEKIDTENMDDDFKKEIEKYIKKKQDEKHSNNRCKFGFRKIFN